MTKPIYKYKLENSMSVAIGQSAILDCPDHPCHKFTNNTIVKTSVVIAFDAITGKVETNNSIYEVQS